MAGPIGSRWRSPDFKQASHRVGQLRALTRELGFTRLQPNPIADLFCGYTEARSMLLWIPLRENKPGGNLDEFYVAAIGQLVLRK